MPGAGERAVEARPVDPVAHDPHDRRRERQRQPRQQQPRREVLAAERPGQRRGRERQVDQQRVADPRPVSPEPHRQGLLARPAVGLEVARVVDHQDRGRQQADRDREHERLPVELLELGEERAGHGDEAEEEEDEHLTETLVPVRARAARVEHAGEDRGDADQQDLPTRGDDQVDADQHRQAERDVGRDQHLLGRDEAAGGHAHRAEPVLGVRAAPRVAVVVGEVRPDLDQQRAEQRGDERQGLEGPERGRVGRADQHGRRRRRQRPRPRGHQPDWRGLKVASGNCAKSGVRLAL